MMVFFPRTTSCVSLKSAVLRQTKGSCGKVPTVMLILVAVVVGVMGFSKELLDALKFICAKL